MQKFYDANFAKEKKRELLWILASKNNRTKMKKPIETSKKMMKCGLGHPIFMPF